MLVRSCVLVACLGLLIALGALWAGVLQAQQRQPLETDLLDSDCVKCHAEVTKEVAEAGMAHRSEVACRQCHIGHPPWELEIIPTCDRCHAKSSSPHYGLIECLTCHNPHKPLEIRLERYITAPCLTCHSSQIKELQAFPSYHTTLDCTSCHEVWHGHIPDCGSCHRPHSATMAEADCYNCHRAHAPLAVGFTEETKSEDCSGCHGEVFEALNKSLTAHREVACLSCHQGDHGTIPACRDCHGDAPHAPAILQQHPNCGTCHNTAHALTE